MIIFSPSAKQRSTLFSVDGLFTGTPSLKLVIHVIHWNYSPLNIMVACKPFQTDWHRLDRKFAPDTLSGDSGKRVEHKASFLLFLPDKRECRWPQRELGDWRASCWNLQLFTPCCHAENPAEEYEYENMYCWVFGILGIGLSGLGCWVSLWVLRMPVQLFLLSRFCTNDLSNIHKLDMKHKGQKSSSYLIYFSSNWLPVDDTVTLCLKLKA